MSGASSVSPSVEWRERPAAAEDGPCPVDPAGLARRLGISTPPGTSGPVTILVAREVMETVFRHGRTSRLEQGGILLGRAYRDLTTPSPGEDARPRHVVDVARALAATGASSTETSFRFGGATWAELRARWLETTPGLDLVGWYHTHPGLGVFFSGTDRATQRDFFARSWLLGLVVDPWRGEEAWFAGARSEPVRAIVRYPEVPVPGTGACGGAAFSSVVRWIVPNVRHGSGIVRVGDAGALRLADGTWTRLAGVRLRFGVRRPKRLRHLERAARRLLVRTIIGRSCEIAHEEASGAVHVVSGGVPVAAALLRAGLAGLIAEESGPHAAVLAEAEREARGEQRGLWARRARGLER